MTRSHIATYSGVLTMLDGNTWELFVWFIRESDINSYYETELVLNGDRDYSISRQFETSTAAHYAYNSILSAFKKSASYTVSNGGTN